MKNKQTYGQKLQSHISNKYPKSTHAEIAKDLGIEVGSVRTYFSRKSKFKKTQISLLLKLYDIDVTEFGYSSNDFKTCIEQKKKDEADIISPLIINNIRERDRGDEATDYEYYFNNVLAYCKKAENNIRVLDYLGEVDPRKENEDKKFKNAYDKYFEELIDILSEKKKNNPRFHVSRLLQLPLNYQSNIKLDEKEKNSTLIAFLKLMRFETFKSIIKSYDLLDNQFSLGVLAHTVRPYSYMLIDNGRYSIFEYYRFNKKKFPVPNILFSNNHNSENFKSLSEELTKEFDFLIGREHNLYKIPKNSFIVSLYDLEKIQEDIDKDIKKIKKIYTHEDLPKVFESSRVDGKIIKKDKYSLHFKYVHNNSDYESAIYQRTKNKIKFIESQ